MADNWDFNGHHASWNIQFNRILNDWEVGAVGDMLMRLQKYSLNAGRLHSLIWALNKNGLFSVKSCYDTLGIRGSIKAPVFWENYIPSKFSFYAWEA